LLLVFYKYGKLYEKHIYGIGMMVDKKWIHVKIDDIVRVTKNSKDSEIRLISTLLVILKNVSKSPKHLILFATIIQRFIKDILKHKLN